MQHIQWATPLRVNTKLVSFSELRVTHHAHCSTHCQLLPQQYALSSFQHTTIQYNSIHIYFYIFFKNLHITTTIQTERIVRSSMAELYSSSPTSFRFRYHPLRRRDCRETTLPVHVSGSTRPRFSPFSFDFQKPVRFSAYRCFSIR